MRDVQVRRTLTTRGLATAVAALLLATSVGVAAGHAAPTPEGCPPDAAAPHGFADATGPHGDAIACIAWLGIALGKDGTTFGTGDPVTRAQLASFVVRLLDRVEGYELPAAADGSFSDVAGSPHEDAIDRLAALDPPVLRGYDDRTFRPSAPIQRAQAAAVIVRTHDHLAATLDEVEPLVPTTEGFTDTEGSVHAQDVARAAEAGLVLGHEDGRFRPGAAITRGQAASVLFRHLGLLAEAGVVPDLADPDDPDGPDEPDGPDDLDETGNRWLDTRRVVNFAHAGGVHEAPQNTLYAFATALEDRGADAIEMDLHITRDGHVVVIHDSTVDRTTDGTGCVVEHTLEELRALDAAHTHVDGLGPRDDRPEADYRYRGVATGEVPPPAGFTAADFRVPTLDEVFDRFPDALLNMDLKPTEVEERDGVRHDCPLALAAMGPDAPDLVAETARLIEEHGVEDTVMVASFVDANSARFGLLAPDVDTSFPLLQAVAFYSAYQLGSPVAPNPDGHVALQVPLTLGPLEIDQDFVDYAHGQGVAVHVWTINDLVEQELLLDWGVDGIVTDEVRQLDQLLRERGEPRPPR